MTLEQLRTKIQEANEIYWETGENGLPEQEYNELLQELRQLCPDDPLLTGIEAPTIASSLGKVTHSKPMLSLDKVYSLEELRAWCKQVARDDNEVFVLQPKYDGISAAYRSAEKLLATRGDGHEGENISDKLPLIICDNGNKLLSNSIIGHAEVRGELLIRKDHFATIFSKVRRKDGSLFKNPRNAVAGIMGLNDITSMQQQGACIVFVPHDHISYPFKLSDIATAEAWAAWEAATGANSILADSFVYPTDGRVIRLQDTEYSESLGCTTHHPRGQVAFKLETAAKSTTLLDIEWSFGKGKLTPVAIFEPIELSGATVRRATLHNYANVEKQDIRIGDTIFVARNGDTIPYVRKSIPGTVRKVALIEECPCCKAQLWLADDDPEIRCKNPECTETNLQRLADAVVRIGIEYLGLPTLRHMVEILKVKNLRDIFALDYNQLLQLPKTKEQAAENLLNNIHKAQTVESYKVLAALNIPGIGLTLSRAIVEAYTLNELRTATLEQLMTIDKVGEEKAKALYAGLREHEQTLLDILSVCTVTEATPDTNQFKTICFTGKMPQPRHYYEQIATGRGYVARPEVVASLSLLVCANVSSDSSKLKAARKYNIPVMTLREWLQAPDEMEKQ